MSKQLTKTLSVQRLNDLGFDTHQIMHKYAAALNKVEEELPSISDVPKADNIELQRNYGECGEKYGEAHCTTQGIREFAHT